MSNKLSGNTNTIMNFDMDVSVINRVELDASWRRENAPTPYNRFYFIEDGQGSVTVNGQTFALTPGSICLIPVGSSFSYACDAYLRKTYLHVNFRLSDGRDLCESLEGARLFPGRESDIAAAKAMLTLPEPERTLRLHALLLTLLCEIADGLTAPREYSPTVRQALAYIERHDDAHPSETAIAEALFVSVDTLRKTFRKEIGQPIVRYARDRSLRQAERLLRTTELPIQEIARRTGFADPLYFSRVFSGRFGSSPKAYREKNGT